MSRILRFLDVSLSLSLTTNQSDTMLSREQNTKRKRHGAQDGERRLRKQQHQPSYRHLAVELT